MHQHNGHFIAFEGNEGAGKTTVLAAIADILAKRGIEVIKTREPGVTALGERIRDLLLHGSADGSTLPICSKAELLLFLAARAQNIEEVIAPALKRGAWVLCDRFNASTIAYQGVGRGLGLDEVESLCHFVCGDIMPDLTLFLEVDPACGLKRSLQVGAHDRIESEANSFHKKVQEGFCRIALRHPENFTRIDANAPLEVVIDSVCKAIDKIACM